MRDPARFLPATGLYFPAPNDPIWLGNTIALDTVADGSVHSPLDYNNADQLVTALELSLGPAGDTTSADTSAKSWDIKVKLNTQRAGFSSSPNQGSAGTGTSCPCPRGPGPAPEELPDDPGTVLHLWEWTSNNVDTIDGVSLAFRRNGTSPVVWPPAEAAFGAGGTYGANAAGFFNTSNVPITAGVSYVFSVDILWRFDPTFRGLVLKWVDAANTLVLQEDFVVGPGHATDTEYHESGTFTAPVGATQVRVEDPHHFAGIFMDNLSISTVSTDPENDSAAINYGDWPHADVDHYLPADYVEARLDSTDTILANVALATLPDVDLETDPPSDGDVLTWDATNEVWVPEPIPAAPPPVGAVGEILIADTGISTPLVFADLLQNEAQDDLIYGDIG